MDAETVWGIAFTVVIVAGVYPLSESTIGPKPDALPGSLQLQMWEQDFTRSKRLLLGWVACFAALMVGWLIFA